MRVLVACEYSGIVRDAFIARGHDAMSCDLLDTERPGPHYTGDMFKLDLSQYDLIIAHPPCTYMSVSGNRYYARTPQRQQSADFIAAIWAIPCESLCIENPVGQINAYLPYMPKPQYIQPWQFGHGETKRTGLWKRGLPDLIPTNIVSGRDQRIWKMPPSPDRGKERARTYQGIADAMADQWGHP
jgi:site-specific DNA-cytosine methylase